MTNVVENNQIIGSAVHSNNNISFFGTNPFSEISNIQLNSDVTSFQWNSDNKYFAYFSTKINISSTDNYQKTLTLDYNNNNTCNFFKTLNDQFFTTGYCDNSFIWKITENNIMGWKTFRHPYVQKVSIDSNLDDTVMGLGCVNKQSIYLFDTHESQSPYYTLQINSNECISMIEFSNTTKNLLSVISQKGSYMLYDINSTQQLFSINNKQNISVVGISHFQNDDKAMLGYANNIIAIYDIHQRKTVASYPLQHQISCFDIWDNHLMIGTEYGKIYYYDFRKLPLPIDVLQISQSKIDSIKIQNPPNILPKEKNDHLQTNSMVKFKRSSKETNITTTPISTLRTTSSLKDMKSMFLSPALKKPKHVEDNSVKKRVSIDEISLSSEQKNDVSISEIINEPQKITENPSTPTSKDTSRVSEKIDSLDFEEMIYDLNTQFRYMQLNFVNQLNHLTYDLKDFIIKTIEESDSSKKQLELENKRLKEEILFFRNFYKNNKNQDI